MKYCPTSSINEGCASVCYSRFDLSHGRHRAMGNLMRNRIFLVMLITMAATTSRVEAQDQVCANNCIKNYNACIAQCGGTRSAMPWEPVAKHKLAKINQCVSSQC